MSVLKIKDQNGNWIQIPTIKGEDGQDYILTENDKQEIAGLVDVPVEDVQVNSTTIVNNGVANIPIADANNLGVIKIGSDYGIGKNSDNRACIQKATDIQIKNGSGTYRPITPDNQNNAVFYGLAKASGDTTQSVSNNAVGTYTNEAKASIKNMLGVEDVDLTDYVQNTDYATSSKGGVVKTGNTIGILNTGEIGVIPATANDVKVGTNSNNPITPSRQNASVFYGLAKASGDTTQSASNNAVGTYTDDAKTAIQTMLGVPSEDEVVTDVQINGSSIIQNGIANIPYASNGVPGLVRAATGYGTALMTSSGHSVIGISAADDNGVKNGVQNYNPIVPSRQHKAVFYGLAKAAGDTTQAKSSNVVGVYTDEAKTAIKQMLGVKDDYDSLVVEVSGTDPVITGKPSYRYNCGELYTLTVTPPASGTMDIIFTSGTTPTVLTLPNTVKMPDWWAGIETNTTYEMCITDGVYCGVMSWAT